MAADRAGHLDRTFSRFHLEPVDGTAADERWEHAETVAERVADWTHRQDDVQVTSNSLREEVVHRQRRRVDFATLRNKTAKIRTLSQIQIA